MHSPSVICSNMHPDHQPGCKKIIVTATLQHTEFYMVDGHIVQKRIRQAYDFPFYCVLIVFIAATTLLTQNKPQHTKNT